MSAFYVTHPEVAIDPLIPVPQWGLSDKGRARAQLAARTPWAKSLRRIIASEEVKAIETARILAEATGIEIEIAYGMGENDRSATGFLPPPEFEKAADWFFAHPDESFQGWERAIDAQARIVDAVKSLFAGHDASQPTAFVGHGGVGTLLKCAIGGLKIARSEDQLAGGGNLFAFSRPDRKLLSGWVRFENAEI